MGYRQVYMETLPEPGRAVGLYEEAGFGFLSVAPGYAGHLDCTIRMLKDY